VSQALTDGAATVGATNPPAARPAISLTDLRKEFGGGRVVALDGVSLEIPTGQLLVLVGSSGSGKSTLLRHVNGLHRPTSGSLDVLGTQVADAGRRELRALRRRVGFIFQQFNLVGRLTAMENVLAGSLGRLRAPRYGSMTFPREVRRAALDQLDRVGLADRAHQRCDTLSGGQQQRVAIARALLQRPEIMLADEPVASLDPESSRQVMDVLARVCREERLTVVCSLHQIDIALGWAHRMVGLRSGKVVLDREPHTLTTDEALRIYRPEEADQVLRAGVEQRPRHPVSAG
jgi:phosphonate transport system ATP-binding protein